MSPQNDVWFFKLAACPGVKNPPVGTHCLIPRSWHQHLSLGMGVAWSPSSGKWGQSWTLKGLCGFERPSGAPLCSVPGPQRAEPGRNESEQLQPFCREGLWPVRSQQNGLGWAQARPPPLGSPMPLQVSSQPWWKALGDKLPRQVRRCAQAHQEDGSLCPSCQVLGQGAFPADLVPRPEALDLFFFFKAWAPEETLPSSSECAKSWAVMGTMCPAEARPTSAINSPRRAHTKGLLSSSFSPA